MKTTFGSEPPLGGTKARVAFDIFDLPKVTSGFKSKILAGFRNHRFRLNPGYQGTTPTPTKFTGEDTKLED